MEACSILLRLWDLAVGKVFLDKRCPRGVLFIAPIQPEVYRKAHGTTEVMAGHRIVCERIRVVAMVVMAVHIVEQTAHMLTQGVIEYQRGVGLRIAHPFRLLEQIREPTVVDALLEPRRLEEEAGQVRFVRALQHAAGDVGQAFVVEDDKACQVILEMLKLAPILKKIPKDVRVGGHHGSGSHDWKLHEMLPFDPEDGIGPKSITLTPEMAKHNSRVTLIIAWSLSMTSMPDPSRKERATPARNLAPLFR